MVDLRKYVIDTNEFSFEIYAKDEIDARYKCGVLLRPEVTVREIMEIEDNE